jgi:23S rRNA (uracil1939-C5)-methyltransferase
VSEKVPHLNELVKILQEDFAKFTLVLNINDKETNVVLGDKFTIIYGSPFYSTEICGIKCDVGVRSFMQVNYYVASKIYQNVIKLVDLTEDTYVIDAYSGAGLMTAMLAKKAKHAYGIEIINEAVQIANNLASKNGLEDKMTNICGDCAEELPPLISDLSAKGKVSVVLDPPRKGCEKKVLDAILKCDIDRIVYVSCNPATLARDVGVLVGALYYDGKEIKKATDYKPNYKVDYVRPYDMFSQTKHVETVVCLTKI